MAYRVGYCPQCDEQVMVQDTNRMWTSFKPNFRQADLTFENGTRCRTIICATCLASPDFEKLIDSITHEDSQACAGNTKAKLKAKGIPISITEHTGKVKNGN